LTGFYQRGGIIDKLPTGTRMVRHLQTKLLQLEKGKIAMLSSQA
jgi:hypothetical protein